MIKFSIEGKNIIENTLELNSAQQKYYKQLINQAIEFLNNERIILEDNWDLGILFSTNYIDDVNSIHFKSNCKDSNGIMIPTLYQKKKEKPQIVINWGKMRSKGVSDEVVISVLIHELVHYMDYFYLEEFGDKYDIDFQNLIKDSIQDNLGGYFTFRSEMRAKYYQEKYSIKNDILCPKYISKTYKVINGEDDFYNISRAYGQLKCWKEACNGNKEILHIIREKEQELLNVNPEGNSLIKIFNIEDFYNFADAIYNQNY